MTSTRITQDLDIRDAGSSTHRHRLRVAARSARCRRPLASS